MRHAATLDEGLQVFQVRLTLVLIVHVYFLPPLTGSSITPLDFLHNVTHVLKVGDFRYRRGGFRV